MTTKVVNNFNTTLASGITNVATSLTMASGAGDILRTKITGDPGTAMAGGDHLYLTITNTSGDIEIIKVTTLAASGDTIGVIARSQDGTTAPVAGWLAGAKISARPVAAIFAEAVLATDAVDVVYGGGTGMSATNVEDAIDELANEKLNIADLPVYGTAATKDIGTASGNVPLIGTSSATETLPGLVELSTNAETVTGTDTARATHSAGVKAAIDAAIAANPSASAIVQVVSAAISAAAGTTSIPDDTSAPLVTEGTEIATLSITPASSSNTVRVSGTFSYDLDGDANSGQQGIIVAVFRGSTLIGAQRYAPYSTADQSEDHANVASFSFLDSPATTSSTTYSVRVGRNNNNIDWYVNRSIASASALASSMANSRIFAEEISA